MGSMRLMEYELFRAAVRGDVGVLSEANITKHVVDYYKDQTTAQENNIVHIAVEHGQARFIEEALARFPELGRMKNGNMDTPLHVAARKGNEAIVNLVLSFVNESWMSNLQGDTPLHLSLSNNKLGAAMTLLIVGGSSCSTAMLLSLVNAHQETPLHVFLKYCTGSHTTADALLEEGVMNLQGVYVTKSQCTQKPSSVSIEDVLNNLLEYKPATCMRDKEGLTPLLIAAQRGCFLALRLILDHCPQSTEVCDPDGRTVLHHLNINSQSQKKYSNELPSTGNTYKELKELFSIPEISAIKDARDCYGNTPAHVALANKDFVMVRVLFEYFADFTVKNKDGVSALDLIKSFPDFASKMEEVTVTEKVWSKSLDENLIQAAEKGEISLFEKITGSEKDIESGQVRYPATHDHDYYLGRTREGLTILHVAVRHGHEEFVKKAIEYFPTLVLTSDSSGETPLHVGARIKKKHETPLDARLTDEPPLNVVPRLQEKHHSVAITLLELTKDRVDKFREEKAGPLCLPWRQKNSKGNTPLHEALRSSNYDMAEKLIDIDSQLSLLDNGAGETPLHILARYGTYTRLDKIGALVKQLIGENESVVYRRDSQGFTPLMRAAYCGRIRVAYWIVHNCPASAQFRDFNGRTFFHHLRLEPTAELDYMTTEDMLYVYTNILKLTRAEFDGFRSSQDHDGNTPLHFALKTKNFAAAKFLLLWCIKSEAKQETNIINNEGHSILELLKSLADDNPRVKELEDLGLLARKQIKEETFDKRKMEKEVYKAAVEGDISLLEKNGYPNDSKFLSKQVATDGSNILHLAIQHGQARFAKYAMRLNPDLIFERDSDGNTPLHFAGKFMNNITLFGCFTEYWTYSICRKYDREYDRSEGLLIIPPWRVKNSQGNTPLHEVYKSPYQGLAWNLMGLDSGLVQDVNHAGETPLHVFTKILPGGHESAMYVRDSREGLTPLLRAARDGNASYASQILQSSLESVQLRDRRGRSFLHLLRVTDDNIEAIKKLFKDFPAVDALRQTIDFDGNTPLHSAIQDGNSIGAKFLAKRLVEADHDRVVQRHLEVRNNEGKSVMDLLASHDDAPIEVLQLLLNKAYGLNIHGLYMKGAWVRSSYGICRSQIKDMANTLSVVAGLLATITFAAAFQVPGGFDGGSGSPVLLQRAAFKVFMISNSLAMCGAMTVLFSLLWVLLTGSASNSFLLIDLSIATLQLSFAATLVSFMMGVYAVVSHEALWLGILVIALCSTVIISMRKNFILSFTRFCRLAFHGFYRCKLCFIQNFRCCNYHCRCLLRGWFRKLFR